MDEKDGENKARVCGECRYFAVEKKRSVVPYPPYSVRLGYCTVRGSRFDRCRSACEVCGSKAGMGYEMTEEHLARIRAAAGKTAKKVLLVELGLEFKSISEAAKFVGRSHQCVSRCIDPAKNPDGSKVCAGYHFLGIDQEGRII